MSNFQLTNVILHVAGNSCKWRRLPESHGDWHSVDVPMNRRRDNVVFQYLFEGLRLREIKLVFLLPGIG